ncbi:VaFE repeat-containing surface-anchored protein [Actinomyces respiraculi]|uniref:VaFE repeat-containing surface-anchored protein n=2 Tax=Actinomyces TaxID=1654 RepID=A0A7T0LK46_9ACTO|nr:VaFE repeat-containing surface-anchored protein [Actinomyces respiraculi]QPL05264.1 VaFE repeat-containing surface-anchored protein [Actinomyces respiraculi]
MTAVSAVLAPQARAEQNFQGSYGRFVPTSVGEQDASGAGFWLGPYLPPSGVEQGFDVWCTHMWKFNPVADDVVSPITLEETTGYNTDTAMSVTTPQMAWILKTYNVDATGESGDVRSLNNAAISMLIHANFERHHGTDKYGDPSNYVPQLIADVQAGAPDIYEQARVMVEAARASNVQGFTAMVVEGDKTRHGNITGVRVTNEAGENVAGVPFQITLEGPAVFDATGTNTWTGTTTAEALSASWTGTGEGEVTIKQWFKTSRKTLTLLSATDHKTQDTITYGNRPESDSEWVEGPRGRIEVIYGPARIGTTATDKADGDKVLEPGGPVTISDKVCQDPDAPLVPGREYTLTATAVDPATGEPYTDADGKPYTGTATFTPTGPADCAVVDVTLPGEALAGSSVVMFESVAHNGKEVATHADVTDKNQTVTVRQPRVGTTATDQLDGDKQMSSGGPVTITDKVCQDPDAPLVPGHEYTLTATAVDPATGEPYTDADGNPYTGTATFTPNTAQDCGLVDVTLPAAAIRDRSVVMFEKVSLGGHVVATHEDTKDEGQTVKGGTTPGIGTTLTDKADGDKVVDPGTVELEDTVCPTNDLTFEPGREYIIAGRLMDRATGKEVPGTQVRTTFTPKTAQDCAVIPFQVDTTNLPGHDLVAFETAYVPGSETEVLASHEDLNDKGQTVTVTTPPSLARTGADVTALLTGAGVLGTAGLLAIATVRRRKAANTTNNS